MKTRTGKKVGTIDCTPKWEGLVPLFVEWIRTGKESQRKHAVEEFVRIAKILDVLMEHRKHGNLSCPCGEEFKL